MNGLHLDGFLTSLGDENIELPIKLFCPKRNFDSIVNLKKAYLLCDSSGDDVILLSPDDLIGDKFNEIDF